tara:strand:+ start:2177 stop:2494 length:318 start_codon:yes stop_codon:yes gene_type:complete
MESAKQERKNLLDINPIAKHASGGSWMSKHSKSAFKMGHSPAEMGHDSPAEFINPGLAKAVGGVAIKTAKKVGKAVKKVAKKVKEDMTGGFEHARQRREMRGGKS